MLANAWLEGTKMADRVKDSDRSLRSLPSSIDLPPARPSCLGACRTHNLWIRALSQCSGDAALCDARQRAATGPRDAGAQRVSWTPNTEVAQRRVSETR